MFLPAGAGPNVHLGSWFAVTVLVRNFFGVMHTVQISSDGMWGGGGAVFAQPPVYLCLVR